MRKTLVVLPLLMFLVACGGTTYEFEVLLHGDDTYAGYMYLSTTHDERLCSPSCEIVNAFRQGVANNFTLSYYDTKVSGLFTWISDFQREYSEGECASYLQVPTRTIVNSEDFPERHKDRFSEMPQDQTACELLGSFESNRHNSFERHMFIEVHEVYKSRMQEDHRLGTRDFTVPKEYLPLQKIIFDYGTGMFSVES